MAWPYKNHLRRLCNVVHPSKQFPTSIFFFISSGCCLEIENLNPCSYNLVNFITTHSWYTCLSMAPLSDVDQWNRSLQCTLIYIHTQQGCVLHCLHTHTQSVCVDLLLELQHLLINLFTWKKNNQLLIIFQADDDTGLRRALVSQ